MATPLLTTKLYIPSVRRRERVVPRPRLIEQLNEGLNGQNGSFARKLTLISAPAGFGKTTLVSEWVNNLQSDAANENQIPFGIAWLSLDAGDNDPTRFLTYFAAALQTTEKNIGKGALGMLHATQPQPPPSEAVLISLINEVAAISHGIILILDDYYLIKSSQVDEALTFMLEHLPPQMHLVIATREDPNLPLAGLRARGQLTELRATDLRFSSSEAAAFLNQVMGLDLSGEDIAALETRTEGWIAGLQLAAISIRGREDASGLIKSFTGSHRLVLDYLVEEVLEQQSESIQTFLLQTAILNRLTGSLCDAVRFGTTKLPTGQEDGQTTLEMLEHANLFIVSLDDERRWYRYHHLFGDLLRVRLRQYHPDKIPMLQIRASEWFEQNGFITDAIEYALRAEDFERAAILLEDVADEVWVRGEFKKMESWLDALPKELLFSKPQLCIFHASSLFVSGRLSEADERLQNAEKALYEKINRNCDTTPGELMKNLTPDQMKMRGRIASARAGMAFYQGDITGLTQYASEALEYLPGDDLSWRSLAANASADAQDFIGDMNAAYRTRLDALEISRAAGNQYHVTVANLKLAIVLRQQGKLQQVIDICQEEMQHASDSGMSHPVTLGLLLAIWGEALVEINELDEAIRKTLKGLELSEQGGDIAGIGWSSYSLTRAFFSTGDLTGAEKVIQKMENNSRGYNIPPWISSIMNGWRVRIWLAKGDFDKAYRWAELYQPDLYEELTHLNELEYFGLVRVLIYQDRFGDAAIFLQSLLDTVNSLGRVWRKLELLILKSFTLQALDENDKALDALQQALVIGRQGGFIRIFVDEGPPMARLLYEALTRGMAPEYVQRLLAAFPDVEPEQASPLSAQAPESDLIEPLSERELEVLQLIAEGLTNQEIASRLYLSLNTVKVHTRNINGKLGVHNRTQAVARARVLGILPLI